MQFMTKPRGLFINPAQANCSIYESGLMMYKSLLLSDKYEIDYQEVDEQKRFVPDTYDFYAFNYHYITMGWLDTGSVRDLPGLKLDFVLEVSPNDPFVLTPSNCFDVYCALDPTMIVADKRVYPFPRPLEVPIELKQYRESTIPVIGSFGFATSGKGFDHVVEAVNKEFDEAMVRINIPFATYADNKNAEYLKDLCLKTAKNGVKVIVTHDFMSKEELIDWCGQNTLNCFLYDRNMPGLSATTDQAISSGRPLAISENDTFRHIATYVKPYPLRSLKESIAISQAEVLQIQKDWAPENFAKRFEQVLTDFNLRSFSLRENNTARMIELKIKPKPKWYQIKLNKLMSKIKRS